MGPSFVIEKLEFQRGEVWQVRYFKSLVTFLVGHSGAGKSTALEALLYSLGLTTVTIMPEIAACAQIRLTFRVAGTRWQATRSPANPKARVSLKNLDDDTEIEHSLPVKSTKADEVTAGAFVQDLLGLPRAVRGTTRLELDTYYNTALALRQHTIAFAFLGGGRDEERILALEAILGLWNPDLAGLEKNAAETASRFTKAKADLASYKKLRDRGSVADPDRLRSDHEQKQREHAAAAEAWQSADRALKTSIGEHGRLIALHKAADADRRKAGKKVTAAHEKLHGATAEHARAEGTLGELLNPPTEDCSRCGQALPEREPGRCQQCGQLCPGVADQRERKIAAARAKLERLRLKLQSLRDVLTSALAAVDRAEDTAATALKTRDTYDQDHLQPTRATAQQAEKTAHGLSRDVARLKQWLDSSTYLTDQQKVVDIAKITMEDAKATRNAALTAHDAWRKELIARWTEFFLIRLQQINPDVETAHIDPTDFTTRIKERDQPDKTFDESSVAGSPKVVTNIAMLLALRDLGRTEPTVRVPPLLIIDSPLADLGAVDQTTGRRLIDTLIDVAGDPSADGYGCQIIAATNDPLPRIYPSIRDIRVDTDNRFVDHAPRTDN
ncbi:ala-rich protein [Streptomyces albus]|uniref:Ala-rich protein n=1 Tax=Streptomyces albus (strain ATCC 21838 / DSM 41398 / FERM P-419 / JCM 4703 / NBRC 107858) TaxID=1081613 RepID=A0A0B5EEM5_STRA4|nr:ala-rich protein [Streptomyces albus]AOU74693.1 ala-rich protein [Streptomyces albus]